MIIFFFYFSRLDDMMNVKVADFGLSRDIYERDYYSSEDRKAKLPVKWMALESLEKGIYNNKTDVVRKNYAIYLYHYVSTLYNCLGICGGGKLSNTCNIV